MKFQVWAIGIGCDQCIGEFLFEDYAEECKKVAEKMNDGWKYIVVAK